MISKQTITNILSNLAKLTTFLTFRAQTIKSNFIWNFLARKIKLKKSRKTGNIEKSRIVLKLENYDFRNFRLITLKEFKKSKKLEKRKKERKKIPYFLWEKWKLKQKSHAFQVSWDFRLISFIVAIVEQRVFLNLDVITPPLIIALLPCVPWNLAFLVVLVPLLWQHLEFQRIIKVSQVINSVNFLVKTDKNSSNLM